MWNDAKKTKKIDQKKSFNKIVYIMQNQKVTPGKPVS